MEDATLDCAALENAALRGVQLVESGRQQSLDRRRDLDFAVRRLAHERQHLLDEQRVALRALEDPGSEPVVDASELDQEQLGLELRKGLEQNARCVQLAAAPRRPDVEELRPGNAQKEQGRTSGEVSDMLDQVEERLLPPVDVVEDADERCVGRLLLEE